MARTTETLVLDDVTVSKDDWDGVTVRMPYGVVLTLSVWQKKLQVTTYTNDGAVVAQEYRITRKGAIVPR